MRAGFYYLDAAQHVRIDKVCAAVRYAVSSANLSVCINLFNFSLYPFNPRWVVVAGCFNIPFYFLACGKFGSVHGLGVYCVDDDVKVAGLTVKSILRIINFKIILTQW